MHRCRHSPSSVSSWYLIVPRSSPRRVRSKPRRRSLVSVPICSSSTRLIQKGNLIWQRVGQACDALESVTGSAANLFSCFSPVPTPHVSKVTTRRQGKNGYYEEKYYDYELPGVAENPRIRLLSRLRLFNVKGEDFLAFFVYPA